MEAEILSGLMNLSGSLSSTLAAVKTDIYVFTISGGVKYSLWTRHQMDGGILPQRLELPYSIDGFSFPPSTVTKLLLLLVTDTRSSMKAIRILETSALSFST